jgi:hypothetical protein
MNLRKIAQKSAKHEHVIYDLQLTKLETDCQNGFISSTHTFSCTSYFDSEHVCVDYKINMWRSLRGGWAEPPHLSTHAKVASLALKTNVARLMKTADSSVPLNVGLEVLWESIGHNVKDFHSTKYTISFLLSRCKLRALQATKCVLDLVDAVNWNSLHSK